MANVVSFVRTLSFFEASFLGAVLCLPPYRASDSNSVFLFIPRCPDHNDHVLFLDLFDKLIASFDKDFVSFDICDNHYELCINSAIYDPLRNEFNKVLNYKFF